MALAVGESETLVCDVSHIPSCSKGSEWVGFGGGQQNRQTGVCVCRYYLERDDIPWPDYNRTDTGGMEGMEAGHTLEIRLCSFLRIVRLLHAYDLPRYKYLW